MLRVPIAYAKPGMVLAMPILHPRRADTILLKSGIQLDAHSIDRLREINLREVWINYPGTEFLCAYYCPEVLKAQAALAQHIANAFDSVVSGSRAKLEYNLYRNAIAELIDRLLLFPRSAAFLQELADHDQPLLRHASTVCMLAVLMGLKLDDYIIVERARLSAHGARDIVGLGLGAMFHDVGMARMAPDVLQRWNHTQDESDPDWRAHVHVGFDVVKNALGPAAAAAVLHHHQKFDGTGFPRRLRLDGTEEPLAGSDIHVFARIVAAADLFDRLRHPPAALPDSTPTPVVRVLKRLQQQPYANWIDPMVFRGLLSVVPPYVPGSIVTLSTGQQAVVTEWFPEDPCRPAVHILPNGLDALGPDDPIERIDLRQRTGIVVARAEGHDVTSDNFFPEHPGQFDIKLAGRALFNAAAVPSRTPPIPAPPPVGPASNNTAA